ncbi:MAG TPA: glycosyltransferase family 2 protein [Flavobacteriales bacterium]
MRVAVVIPCFNVEAHLASALDSVLAQHHTDLDIVCVDDGSSDGTRAVIERYCAAHPERIRGIYRSNGGASQARNVGLEQSEGDFVQFLDADDMLAPDKISAQVALLRADTDLVVGDFEQVMPDGMLLPALSLYDRPWMALVRTRMGTTSANLWSRRAVQRAGGWNEALASSQDYELIFRMLKNDATVVWDPHQRTRVLKRASGSISRTDVMRNWDRYIALRRSMKDHLETLDPRRYAEEIESLRQYIFMALRIVAKQDRKKAVQEYARSVGRGFVPLVGPATTEKYVLFHRLLGFANTERMLQALRNART